MKERAAGKFIRSFGKYIVTFFLFIVAGGVLFYLTYQNIHGEMIDGLNARQLIHAKQAVRGIDNFFGDHINILKNYSKNEHIATMNESGKRLMREFILNHRGETSIISRIDSRGRILYAEPYDRKVIGLPVTKMEEFLKVKHTHQIVISDVFTNRRGFQSIIVHAPVFKNGRFNGTLSLLLSFEFIAKRYIEDIRIGKDGYARVVSRDGIELFCPIPGHQGKSVFDNYRDFPDIIAMAKKMTRGEQGVTTYMDDLIRGDVVSKATKHAVFMPIRVGDNFWSIVVATPEDEVTSALSQFRNRILLIVILFVIGIGLFFYMLIKTMVVVKEVEQRRKADEALRESEENYRRSLDESPLGVRIVTAKTETIYANRAILDFYGYDSIEELKSTPVEKRYTTQSYAEFQIRRQKRKRGDYQPSEYEISIIRKNSDVRHLQVYRKEILWNGERQNQVVYQDITERKKGEDALVKSEEKFRLITENMVDCVALVDINGVYQYVTPSYRNILGYDPEDMIGIKGITLTHPDDVERITRIYLEGIEQGWSEKHFESRTRHKDGHYVNMELRARLLNDSQGKLIGAIWAARDITKRLQLEQERKLAEDALRHSEENYRSVIENIQDVFYRTDTQGILIMASPSFANLLEYESLDVCLGKPIAEVAYYEPDKRKEFLRALQDKGTVTNYEVVLKRKDGTPVAVETNSHFYLDDDGNIAGVEGIYRDMTERKQVEEKLRESEDRFRKVFEEAHLGIVISSQSFVFEKVNPAFCSMMGYSADELHSMTFADITHPDYISRDKENVKKVRQGVMPFYKTEKRYINKKGEILWGELVVSSVRDEQGALRYYLSLVSDITSRKQAEESQRILEERLQQADKMEAIGTLAGGIAHDFNNLLMGIQGYASMTLLNLDPTNPNYERLKRIEQQVQSGADLTSQLLGFARGGRYEVKPSNINEIIEKTSSMFGRTKKEISINRKTAKDLWNVEVDRGQMEQVFLNLYVNAWQAMPGGGEIYLETDNVLLNDEQVFPYAIKPGKYVKITITDTGTGMDEKTQERIFDPFFTTKEMGRGTGLGLATVYGIIKGHHGLINVYSETGHGTTFTIYLPASEKEILKEKTPKDEITRGTETILLIDDEQMVMEVNQELLESIGYKVYVAGSGQEGIAVYMEKRDKIDLVILDMIMPGISGSETFDRLREINPKIKVLLSSGYSLNGEAKHIMDRGCNGFLQKPFRLEELSGKVRAMLG
jgi:two-component system cell cycle sensor histidine kinase/response regulator CckA